MNPPEVGAAVSGALDVVDDGEQSRPPMDLVFFFFVVLVGTGGTRGHGPRASILFTSHVPISSWASLWPTVIYKEERAPLFLVGSRLYPPPPPPHNPSLHWPVPRHGGGICRIKEGGDEEAYHEQSQARRGEATAAARRIEEGQGERCRIPCRAGLISSRSGQGKRGASPRRRP